MFLPGIQPGTLCMCLIHANHYTTETLSTLRLAEKWWSQGLSTLLQSKDVLTTWRDRSEKERAGVAKNLGLVGMMLAGILATKISQ